MRVYAITYDLNRPGQKYELLYQAIKNLGTHWHFMQNTWLVCTALSAAEVRDHLARYVDSNDKLFVAKVTEAAWQGFDDNGNRWIKQQVEAAA